MSEAEGNNPLKRKLDGAAVSAAMVDNEYSGADVPKAVTRANAGAPPVEPNVAAAVADDPNMVPLDNDYEVIRKYLEWNCEPIKFPQAPDGSFRPVALDGASGVGKTQQAFALLKHGRSVVYFLLIKVGPGSQPIYKKINDLQVDFALSLDEVNKAVEALKGAAEAEKWDPLSEDFIGLSLRLPAVSLVVSRLYRMSMTYKEEKLVTPNRTKNLPVSTRLADSLRGTVLFLDEALPKGRVKNSENRLRFMRNLGCVLKMQVVAAGTASTVVNLIKQSEEGDEASRTDFKDTSLWIQCQLHWSTVHEDDLDLILQQTQETKDLVVEHGILKTLLLEERPLLVDRFSKNSGSLSQILDGAGQQLMDVKNASKGAKLTWLMGTWLERENLSSCPFAIKPPDLVVNHFFEPALQVHRSGEEPCLIKGIVRTKNKAGPLAVSVHKICANDIDQPDEGSGFKKGAWAVSYENASSYVLTSAFADVTRALSPCVQQCLAREPLLAIALSYQHEYDNGKQFQDDLSACQRESAAEHTLGAMSGEQMESVVFAAIQLASNRRNHPHLLDFCERLIDFLEPKASHGEIKNAACLKFHLPTKAASFQNLSHSRKKKQPWWRDEYQEGSEHALAIATKAREAKVRTGEKKVEEMEKKIGKHDPCTSRQDVEKLQKDLEQLQKDLAAYQSFEVPSTSKVGVSVAQLVRMPRMVPASSPNVPDWAGKHTANPNALQVLEDLAVAGLVPGETNARCDINAFPWPFAVGGPCWSFEVKARSTSYSKQDGIIDLVAKCRDDNHGGAQFNAMLIAVRGQGATELDMWKITNEGGEYWRVLVLVSGLTV